ncbi:nuclear pore complex protein Nup214 [Rhinichthys klamathensis goyatoka]|uniref:nuclear pore complex protein Nup214 n=1 Tax=Rhinichthys klamathensis goyatoka TaxID=3034132 RepID=UPI0024B49D00|nr:nuclear pore complex protein Nup214 [Rhinichthys klamathensis goyatoka]
MLVCVFSLDRELESLKEALLKASLETAPKAQDKSPSKMTPAKQSQLRNFLSKRQTPPVRSTAPANLSRSAFLCPQFYEDLDEVSSSSSLSQVLEPEDSLALAEDGDEPLLMPSVSRHPTVVRTPSIQPGFSTSPFSRVPIISAAPKINMDSADSTALATKTVKHGAPPTEKATPTDKATPTSVPAPQAAGRAALSRHMTSQKPGACLTESTLKTVPQVVNVQELKDKGPHTPVSTVISASVPAPAAQVVQQVLATVEASKSSFQAALKGQSPAQATSSSFVFGGAAKPDAGASSSVSEKSSKGFSFSTPSAGFSFTSQSPDANNTQAKSSGPPGKFSFASSSGSKMPFGPGGSEEPFSFTPKLASPAPSASSSTPPPETPKLPHAPKAQGETLGCFSGLRVGQSEELKDASKPALGFTFGNGSTGFGFNSAQIKPAETGSTTAELESATTEATKTMTPQALGTLTPADKPLEAAAPAVKPTFTIPSTTFPPDATSFGSLLRAPLQETTLSTNPLPTTTASPEVAKEEAKEPPSPKPLALSAPVVSATEAAAPIITETITATSNKPPTPPTLEVSPAPPPSVTPPSDTPTAVSEPPLAEPVANPALETISSSSLATPASQEPPATSASDKPGSIFAPPLDAQTVGFSTVVTTSASSTPSTAITTSAAPTFGQSPAAPSTAFGSTAFGATSTPGFGKLAFGQSPAGFGQPAASDSASNFSFGQAAFSASPGFGTPATTSTTSTATGGGAGMFGAASANSASSFSFAAGTGSAPGTGTGTGLFSQSSAPGFGQPSAGFGQGSMFGSNTTTASSGFGFGQPSGFGSSTSSSSVFGQQPGVFGQAQSGAGLFGSGAGNTSSGSGFFSGLGGKPSEDAANKNPFGAPAAGGFGQPINTGPANLFGSSGAKAFSFSSSSFGEQKPSGSFSTGAGSVAAQGFGSFSTPTKPAGFGSAPVFGSPPTFGGSPAFGASAGFGSAPSFSAPMGSSGGKVFGEGTTAANVGGFGFASPPNAPSFGSLANPSAATPSFGSPAGFGTQTGTFPGFGSSGGFGGFGNANTNQPSAQTFNSWRS